MKIVIDLPEYLYDRLHDTVSDDYALNVYEEAIFYGKILPKGHGRLIDADKLKPRDLSPEAWYSPMWGYNIFDIEDAETVIEADNAESEDMEVEE